MLTELIDVCYTFFTLMISAKNKMVPHVVKQIHSAGEFGRSTLSTEYSSYSIPVLRLCYSQPDTVICQAVETCCLTSEREGAKGRMSRSFSTPDPPLLVGKQETENRGTTRGKEKGPR